MSLSRWDEAPRDLADLPVAAASLEGLDRAVMAIDGDGVVVLWNARAASVSGWSEDAVQGRALAELLHGALAGVVATLRPLPSSDTEY